MNVQLTNNFTIYNFLVVDDEPESAQNTRSILESHGYEASIAKDGGQTHSAIRMNRPGFVIMKIILSGESGFEICEWIKNQDEFMPVMLLTEIDLDSARNLSARVGADGYLTKPFQSEKLIEMIDQITRNVNLRKNNEKKEKGRIRFRCSCGQKLKERLENRGKSVNCPSCNERVQIPQHSLQEFVVHRSELTDDANATEPLKFITVKCQHCATFYKLFSSQLDTAKTCPKCRKEQVGSLSIVGAPLSRAALASSLRVLRILTGKNKGKKLLLPEKTVSIGTHKSCHIRNSAVGFSEKHCSLTPTLEGIRVVDLGSETGTLINGKKIEEETILHAGEVLKVGNVRFRLIGRDRDVAEEQESVQMWSHQEQLARDKGTRIYHETMGTAVEAAQVIQQHWDISRKRAMVGGQAN